MSLKVWLPLLGNINNYGVANVTTTATALVDEHGKLGKCYTFDGVDKYVAISGQEFFDCFKGGTQPFSIAMWAYHADSTRAVLFGDFNTTGKINFNIELNVYHQLRFYWDSNPDTMLSDVNIGLNTWNHIAVVYDGTDIKGYLNGVLKNTVTVTLSAKNKTSGEFRLGRDDRTGTTAFNGMLNDVRVYDHALSVGEVQDIAKGLTTHYKLDDIVNPNLIFKHTDVSTNGINSVNAWKPDGITRVFDEAEQCVKFTDSGSGNRRTYVNCTYVWTEIGTYTVSFDAKAQAEGQKITVSRSVSDYSSYIYLSTKWEHYVAHVVTTETATAGTLTVSGAAANDVFWLKNLKVERGSVGTAFCELEPPTTVTDSTVCNRDATIVGTVTPQESARYTSCAQFNTSQLTFSATRILQGGYEPELTVAFWAKSNNNDIGGMFVYKLNTTFQFSSSATGGLKFRDSYHGSTQYNIEPNTSSLNLNEWNHYAYVYDRGKCYIYINGKLNVSSETEYHEDASLSSFDSMQIGTVTSSTGDRCFNGCMSDYRVYTTRLSDEYIQELYQLNASVLRGDDMQAYAFSETGDIALQNNGVTSCEQICELPELMNLKYDTNVYFEPDGSAWVRIYHHGHPSTVSFESTDTFSNSVYKDEDRWFNVQVCDSVTSWEFLIKQRAESTTANESKYRWIQNVNPMTATYANVASANITKITTTGYTSFTHGGLYKKNDKTYLCTNNGTESNWWGAIGAWSLSGGGNPSWGIVVVKTGYTDLYLRVDNLVSTTSQNVAFKKSQAILGDQFIEI